MSDSTTVKLDPETAADKKWLIKHAPHGTVTKICCAAIRRKRKALDKKAAK